MHLLCVACARSSWSYISSWRVQKLWMHVNELVLLKLEAMFSEGQANFRAACCAVLMLLGFLLTGNIYFGLSCINIAFSFLCSAAWCCSMCVTGAATPDTSNSFFTEALWLGWILLCRRCFSSPAFSAAPAEAVLPTPMCELGLDYASDVGGLGGCLFLSAAAWQAPVEEVLDSVLWVGFALFLLARCVWFVQIVLLIWVLMVVVKEKFDFSQVRVTIFNGYFGFSSERVSSEKSLGRGAVHPQNFQNCMKFQFHQILRSPSRVGTWWFWLCFYEFSCVSFLSISANDRFLRFSACG